jgi:hypothetical protein
VGHELTRRRSQDEESAGDSLDEPYLDGGSFDGRAVREGDEPHENCQHHCRGRRRTSSRRVPSYFHTRRWRNEHATAVRISTRPGTDHRARAGSESDPGCQRRPGRPDSTASLFPSSAWWVPLLHEKEKDMERRQPTMRKPRRPATLAISLMLCGLLLAPAAPWGAVPDLERGHAGAELPRAPSARWDVPQPGSGIPSRLELDPCPLLPPELGGHREQRAQVHRAAPRRPGRRGASQESSRRHRDLDRAFDASRTAGRGEHAHGPRVEPAPGPAVGDGWGQPVHSTRHSLRGSSAHRCGTYLA